MNTQELLNTLRTTFHFQEFRPGQLEALQTLMTRQRLLCIQPTGYGKSLLYQLPSVLLGGISLVISPLLALMRDQLQQLQTRFGIAAASINTDQTDEENQAAKQAAIKGKIRILFIAPEQLDHIDRFNFLLQLPLSLLVVDEAHCISTWGHDFRPSYRQITQLVQAAIINNPQLKLLALTATANAQTEADIKQQFSVNGQDILVHRESMDRPNIRLSVIPCSGIANKLLMLKNLLGTQQGAGLIYCATRENTQLVADYLCANHIKAIAYHAGIAIELKRHIQQEFIADKYPVIAATNALGMGIDKSNLRFIIHFDFPGSITAYYQEVGRCGRDGLPANGILLYDAADSKIQTYFIESAQPQAADFQQLLQAVKAAPTLPNLMALKCATGMHPTRLTVMVTELVEQGFLEKISLQGLQVYRLTAKSGAPDLSRYTLQLQLKHAELTAIQHYAEQSQQCLMCLLRAALGDPQGKPCGQCSVCVTPTLPAIIADDHAAAITTWLNQRTAPITLNKRIKNLNTGIAVLDGKLHSKEFVSFMRHRANSSPQQPGITAELLQLTVARLRELHQQLPLGCLAPVPSRTWGAADAIATLLAGYLQIPALRLLHWHKVPEARQGALLNNDQRRNNVHQNMRAKLTEKIPPGAILLFDDYTGSGATLNEAARALRQHPAITHEIIPCTIAAVKWRLGQSGMI